MKCTCPMPSNRLTEISKSDRVTVCRCSCGLYWLKCAYDTRLAMNLEPELCEHIEALSRFVPKAVTS